MLLMVQRPEQSLGPPLWMNAKAGKQAFALPLEKRMGRRMGTEFFSQWIPFGGYQGYSFSFPEPLKIKMVENARAETYPPKPTWVYSSPWLYLCLKLCDREESLKQYSVLTVLTAIVMLTVPWEKDWKLNSCYLFNRTGVVWAKVCFGCFRIPALSPNLILEVFKNTET